MSKSNENHPIVSPVYLDSLTTDNTQVPLMHFPKKSKIKSIYIMNGANIAASDSNFVELSVKKVSDDSVVASYDSRAAGEGALTALEAKAFDLVEAEIEAGESLYFDYQETGSVGLTNAQLGIEHFPY